MPSMSLTGFPKTGLWKTEKEARDLAWSLL